MSHARSAALCFAALCLFAPAMHAGLITFVATGVTQDGAMLSGDVIINTTAGSVSSASLTMMGALSFTVSFDAGSSFQFAEFDDLTFDNGSTFPFVGLDIPVSTLVGYAGGSICTVGSPCPGGGVSEAASGNPSSEFTSGSLTAVPEPASVALVGSALLGLAAWRRRRNTR